MKVEQVSIGKLLPDPNNVRQHDEKNLASIKASLSRFGQHRPAVVQKSTGIVLIGNGMVEAAKSLGMKTLAVFYVDDDDTKAIARAIADNRTAELATWDEERLPELLSTLDEDFLAEMDFDLSDFEVPDFGPTDLDDQSDLDAPQKPVTCPECSHEFYL